MNCKFHINNYKDRQEMVWSLANAGYKVWIEEITVLYQTNYYVCVYIPEKDVWLEKEER